jgi:hypothetical protein
MVPLRDYLDALREADLRWGNIVRESDLRASEVSRIALEKRFESVNEWREQSKQRELMFMPREEYSANQKALEGRLASVERLVWGGVGVGIAIQIAMQIAFHFLR